ncbi:MAG: hypothetical protein ABUS48_00900 [Pseudomonadota bacterium]
MTIRKSSDTFVYCSIFKVTVETNGYQGGDAGHGGFATVTLKDEGGTSWSAEVDGQRDDDPKTISIRVGGDSEIRNLILALRFAAHELEVLTSKRVLEDAR